MNRFAPLRLLCVVICLLTAGLASQASAQAVGPGDVLISEFRLEGPASEFDEYIEFYCNRDTDCDISNYNIIAFDPSFGDFATSFPSGTIIPARQHLLVGDDFGYSLNSYAGLDLFASANGDFDFFVDNEGFQLTNADETVVIDSVGFIGGGGKVTYIEGTGLQRATGARPNDQYAYVRKANPLPQDTNNNANDFVLVSVTGNAHPGITAPPVLGAPGPQALTSPISFTAASFPVSLPEPAAAQSASPNRVRVGSGDSGTLSIRRSFTNNLSEPVEYLAFRVYSITTLNSPSAPGQAQLRLVSSEDGEIFTTSLCRNVAIRGTILEFDNGTEPNQPIGGGLNSTVFVAFEKLLAPGDTVDVQFLLNVVQAGNYRFFVNIEAFPSEPESLALRNVRAAAVRKAAATQRKTVGPRRLVAGLPGTPKRKKGGLRTAQ